MDPITRATFARVLPAHAGMILGPDHKGDIRESAPRARGDDPKRALPYSAGP